MGDFYWLNEVEGKTILVVADCTGHGVPGAFMTMIGNTLLDKIVRLRKITNPAEILETLHEEIWTVLRQEETDNNSGMDAAVLTIKPDNEGNFDIVFAGAKNSLVYKTKEEKEVKEIIGVRKSIGGIQNKNISFKNHQIMFKKDWQLYLGSDGYEDQNDAKRKKFGRERLVKLLEKISDLPLSLQQKRLEEELEKYIKGTQQRDDILLIGIKF